MENRRNIDINDDPYKSMSLIKNASIEAQYSRLTQEEKDLIFLKVHGYNVKPPTIEQLYSDPYYLGSADFFDGGTRIFDYWKDALGKIYPGYMTRFPFLCLSGAIGKYSMPI